MEVDGLVRAGKASALDRVANMCWLPGALVMRDVEAYCSRTDTQLQDFPRLFVTLQDHALCPCVGRRVEKGHAVLKRVGSYKFGIIFPCLCSLWSGAAHSEDAAQEP